MPHLHCLNIINREVHYGPCFSVLAFSSGMCICVCEREEKIAPLSPTRNQDAKKDILFE